MGSRGRKSIASPLLSGGSLETLTGPTAPYDLADSETAEWRAIVAAMPPDHFRRTHFPMLSQLCRHIIASRRVAMLIEQASKRKNIDAGEYALLLRMQSAETTAIIRLSRAMRLTHQALYRGESANLRPLNSIDPPWEFHDKSSRQPWDRERHDVDDD
jgi:hypothetical protein